MKKRYWIIGSLLVVLGFVSLVLVLVINHLKRNQDIDPPDFSDLAPTRQPVPDELNAYPLLLEASQVFVEDEQDLWASCYEGEEEDPSILSPLIASNQVAFAKVRESTPLPGIWYEIEYSYDTLLPEIRPWLQLARLMMADAELTRRKGDYEEAALRVIDLNQFGLKVGADGAALISHLVGIAISELGVNQTGQMVRDANCPSSVLSRLEVSLRDGSRYLEGSAESFRSEFTVMKTFFDQLSEDGGALEDVTGSPVFPAQNIPLVWGYMFQRNRSLLIAADYLRPFLRNSDQMPIQNPEDDVGQVLEEWNALSGHEKMLRPNNIGMMALNITLPGLTDASDKAVQAYTSREASRILIALRLYEIENGHLPETLEQLAPTFLTELPLDPFSGQSFRYDRDRELIWSIGKDRVDQGGDPLDEDGEASRNRSPTGAQDQVYSLRKTYDELVEEAQNQKDE